MRHRSGIRLYSVQLGSDPDTCTHVHTRVPGDGYSRVTATLPHSQERYSGGILILCERHILSKLHIIEALKPSYLAVFFGRTAVVMSKCASLSAGPH